MVIMPVAALKVMTTHPVFAFNVAQARGMAAAIQAVKTFNRLPTLKRRLG